MRRLLCEECGHGWDKYARYRRPSFSDPAEYIRQVWGVAKLPQPEQRVITIQVEGKPDHIIPMDKFQYECDSCNKTILPGDAACAVTAWIEGRPIPRWEHEFLEVEL